MEPLFNLMSTSRPMFQPKVDRDELIYIIKCPYDDEVYTFDKDEALIAANDKFQQRRKEGATEDDSQDSDNTLIFSKCLYDPYPLRFEVLDVPLIHSEEKKERNKIYLIGYEFHNSDHHEERYVGYTKSLSVAKAILENWKRMVLEKYPEEKKVLTVGRSSNGLYYTMDIYSWDEGGLIVKRVEDGSETDDVDALDNYDTKWCISAQIIEHV